MAAVLGMFTLCAWQPPAPHPPGPPPHPPLPPKPRPVEDRLIEIRQRLAREPEAATAQERLLVEWAERFLGRADDSLKQANRPAAERLADAADACRRPLDHLAHLRGAKAPGPPLPPAPPDGPSRHLQQVYFRLRLASYFVQQIPPPSADPLLGLAQQFYQNGVRAQEAGETRAADDYAKAADDLTHALESAAQAAALQP